MNNATTIAPTTTWTKGLFFGRRKSDQSIIYLSAPSWDCGWYWGFGYLGNKHEHYHLSSYANGRDINMYDALVEDYRLNETIQKDLWKFCDLFKTAYALQDVAEIYHRGNSHYTNTGLEAVIKSPEECERINWVLLPKIFDRIEELFGEES